MKVSEGPTHLQLLRKKEPAHWLTSKLQPRGPLRAAASVEGPGRTGQPQRRGRRQDERRRRGSRVGVARIAAVSLLGGAELGAEGVDRRLCRGPEKTKGQRGSMGGILAGWCDGRRLPQTSVGGGGGHRCFQRHPFFRLPRLPPRSRAARGRDENWRMSNVPDCGSVISQVL